MLRVEIFSIKFFTDFIYKISSHVNYKAPTDGDKKVVNNLLTAFIAKMAINASFPMRIKRIIAAWCGVFIVVNNLLTAFVNRLLTVNGLDEIVSCIFSKPAFFGDFLYYFYRGAGM